MSVESEAIKEVKELIDFVKKIGEFDNGITRSRMLFSLHCIILEADEPLSLENFINYHNSIMTGYLPLDFMAHLTACTKKPEWITGSQYKSVIQSIYESFSVNFENILNHGVDSWNVKCERHESELFSFVENTHDIIYLWFDVPNIGNASLSEYLVGKLNKVIESEKATHYK